MKTYLLPYLLVSLILASSCSRDAFLSVKPDSSLLVPSKMEDFKKLLNHTTMNLYSAGLGLIASDDIFIDDRALNGAIPEIQGTYLWEKDMYRGKEQIRDWDYAYSAIFIANNVIHHVPSLSADETQKNDLIGQALFKRAFAMFDLASHYCHVYSARNLGEPGIPIVLSPDVTEIYQRSTIKETFDQIIKDLEEAYLLISLDIPSRDLYRPSKQACLGLLSRIYIYMGDYKSVVQDTESLLLSSKKLLDFNKIDTNSIKLNALENPEIIYDVHSCHYAESSTWPTAAASVCEDLYDKFAPSDLRRNVYFQKKNDGTYNINHRLYGPLPYPFTGITTSEVYLNVAESHFRLGNDEEARLLIAELQRHRYNDTFNTDTLQSLSPEDFEEILFLERRKELVWRNLRWLDLKRFDRDGHSHLLRRENNSETVELEPNSLRYVFPIPQTELNRSSIEQNPR